MWTQIFLFVSLITVGVRGQFPFTTGFNPAIFESQLQNMFAGLRARILTTQRTIADNLRRAQASGTVFNTRGLRPGEFRRFTGPDGRSRGFAFRSADGQSSGVSFSSGGQGSGYFFSGGPGGTRFYRF